MPITDQQNSARALDRDISGCTWLVDKVRASDVYAQNLYAAMCNQQWQYQDVWSLLKNYRWSCSWRCAGGIVADLRDGGDYYCSGIGLYNLDDITTGYVGEGVVTDEIRQDLGLIGWYPVDRES